MWWITSTDSSVSTSERSSPWKVSSGCPMSVLSAYSTPRMPAMSKAESCSCSWPLCAGSNIAEQTGCLWLQFCFAAWSWPWFQPEILSTTWKKWTSWLGCPNASTCCTLRWPSTPCMPQEQPLPPNLNSRMQRNRTETRNSASNCETRNSASNCSYHKVLELSSCTTVESNWKCTQLNYLIPQDNLVSWNKWHQKNKPTFHPVEFVRTHFVDIFTEKMRSITIELMRELKSISWRFMSNHKSNTKNINISESRMT